jgi:methylase of polypeptide subunit release factors
MSIIIDPEGNETQALFDLHSEWKGKSVLEIGSGDGRLTWRYAEKAARVVAVEPSEDAHALALKNRPNEMAHVEFFNIGFDEFARQNKERFDLALFSWSL